MFDNRLTLAKNVDRFSKLFYRLLIHTKILCIHHKDFHHTCNMLLHYLVKVENPKMVILTASSTNCCRVPGDTLNTSFNI